ncbi:hypothetical protein HLRTI_002911 [Halorhabdus tiamatea SARL4B]|uniref:Uncharacterized protein n=1 Tax=Halorhabdus tiamatea SARL4B TaxID=1033806 RepID=U2DGG9_9EURY|nr:hypothetical protein HLRTI_002911 [Halorhabdus tiamatea SARL4B]
MSDCETVEIDPCAVCSNDTGYTDPDGKTRCTECDEVLPGLGEQR